MTDFSLIFMALVVGFFHSFEADHLAAVSNLVSTKKSAIQSLKDGMFWGIGHTVTIFFIGVLILVLKYSISENIFSKFEGLVGIMLIVLGIYRLSKLKQVKQTLHHGHNHKLALGVGLIHGIAGSGAVVATAVSATSTISIGLLYLTIFGMGSILGMLCVAFILGKILYLKKLENINIVNYFSVFSSLFCIVFGLKIFIYNFI